VRERLSAAVAHRAFTPLAPRMLALLPADAMAVLAIGIDGPALWSVLREPLIAAIAAQERILPADVDELVGMDLAANGLPPTLAELVGGCHGTFAIALTPSAPYPGVVLLAPRTPTIDALVAWFAREARIDLPDEGESVSLANVMLPVVLRRHAEAWMLGLIAGIPEDGWPASPLGRAVLATAGADAAVLGASDTPALLRCATGFLPLLLGDLDGDQREAVTQAVARATAIAGIGSAIGRAGPEGYVLDVEGLFGLGVFPGIAGALIGSGLPVGSADGGIAAAAATLQSGVFPAQIQFQAGGYADGDADGIGEYGFPDELSGAPVGDGTTLSFLPPAFNAREPEVDGWHYRVWMPAKDGGAVDSPATRAASGDAERAFVVYAWPVDAEDGARILAITAAGRVLVGPWTGEPPAWNALWGGGGAGWDDAPTWQPYGR
jgi:hypothetical protein